MLRPAQNIEYQQKPRKMVKVNLAEDDNYNQFKGQCAQQADQQLLPLPASNIPQEDYKQQQGRYRNIYSHIQINKQNKISQNKQIKPSIDQKHKEKQVLQKQKNDTKEPVQLKAPAKKSKEKKLPTGTSNWNAFRTNKPADQPKTKSGGLVAIDCQFLRNNQLQLLGRVSIVDENGKQLLDSYVRPNKVITDYLTPISGITYAHIKNAPSEQQVLEKVKKIIYNKIVVGHTLWKDLEVCRLQKWKGIKAKIDISQFKPYQQANGKLISLKNLSSKLLGKAIQQGMHSSLQDAAVTMRLFNLRKKEILKQFSVIA